MEGDKNQVILSEIRSIHFASTLNKIRYRGMDAIQMITRGGGIFFLLRIIKVDVPHEVPGTDSKMDLCFVHRFDVNSIFKSGPINELVTHLNRLRLLQLDYLNSLPELNEYETCQKSRMSWSITASNVREFVQPTHGTQEYLEGLFILPEHMNPAVISEPAHLMYWAHVIFETNVYVVQIEFNVDGGLHTSSIEGFERMPYLVCKPTNMMCYSLVEE